MLRDEVAGLTLSDDRDDGWILLRDGPYGCQPEAFAVTNLIFIADDENSSRIYKSYATIGQKLWIAAGTRSLHIYLVNTRLQLFISLRYARVFALFRVWDFME